MIVCWDPPAVSTVRLARLVAVLLPAIIPTQKLPGEGRWLAQSHSARQGRAHSGSRVSFYLEATLASTLLSQRRQLRLGRETSNRTQTHKSWLPRKPGWGWGWGIQFCPTRPSPASLACWLLLHFSESLCSCPTFLPYFPRAQSVHVGAWGLGGFWVLHALFRQSLQQAPSPLSSGREVLGQGLITYWCQGLLWQSVMLEGPLFRMFLNAQKKIHRTEKKTNPIKIWLSRYFLNHMA